MRKLYTGLAWTIAGAVVVQAAAIAFAFGGMLNLVSRGRRRRQGAPRELPGGRRRASSGS